MAQLAVFGYRRIQKGIVALALMVALLCCLVGLVPARARAESQSSAVVIEATTGRVLYASDAYASRPMASTTKILTAITVLEHLDVHRVVEVDPRVVGVEGSSIYLRAGERWQVEDLLYGLMLRSGNDAAMQLALSTAGSVEAFAALMNDVARKAGAWHSHFVNPHGLHHPDHYTTAYDLACITAYAMRNADFCRIVATRRHDYEVEGEKRTFFNKNKMLVGYEGAIGVKTGYTKAAGRCLVTAAERDGMRLVSVVLNEYDMWYRSSELLDSAFATYGMRPVWSAGEVRSLSISGTPTLVTVPSSVYYPLSAAESDRLVWSIVPQQQPLDAQSVGVVGAELDGCTLFTCEVYTLFRGDFMHKTSL